ncbi:MAG TPA: hypothetical protein VGW75_08575 [Solirubrobacteraceae bacterium]|jgi:hypothetical protein|nr:hypothetical protein [Solirubrobacteraceae bacterium]
MGLLDDAIREHLELKRRRGADPAEVAEQEREALGPVRGAADTATAEPPPAAVAEPELELDPEPEPEHHAPPEHHGAVRAPDPPPADAGAGEPAQQFPPDDPHGDDAPPAADAAGEDVLDETPDFLQEAPEHDRLWFEQRPPRDFDF